MQDRDAPAHRHEPWMGCQRGHGRLGHVLIPLLRGHAERCGGPCLVDGNVDSQERGGICALERVHTIISDASLAPDIRATLAARGIEVLIAE